ncbi:peptidoglycan editing factor PgeF [Telmatospirillum sp.]|uniref:peptidoglycan editing factor PgeF n=1 Tax=Telmatospirillum sp. TaxID=2079197 RepID=UPI00283B449F|nr:peptidoglycan editing factor PgeF [Telmatospirillum sp.]MDR3438481.1 peptidoglycan editing factor PgeF [Telmatospirillum sp.]
MITLSTLNEVLRIRHGFFTREGGTSEGIYTSLNCGLGSNDDPARVTANRTRALALLDLEPRALATVQQQHTTDVVVVDDKWTPDAPIQVADAMVTSRAGVALGILTADCAPVLLADPRANVIGAAHAGWRGALAGVLDNTIAAMIKLGAKPSRIAAAVGPCIAHRSYEVGPEFPAPFLAEDPDNHFFFAPAVREGHFYFDLPGFIARRLAKLSVIDVARTPCDTYREESRFFSYRRSVLKGEKDFGRALSVIVLER